MFGLGFTELLIFLPLILVAIVLVLSFRRKSALRQRILRRLERAQFERALPHEMANSRAHLPYIPLPIALGLQSFFAFFAVLLMLNGNPFTLTVVFEIAVFVGGPVLLGCAFISHAIHRTSRKGIYEQLLAGLGLFTLLSAKSYPGEETLQLFLLLCTPAVALGFQVFFSRFCSVVTKDRLPSIYRMTMSLAKWVLFFCFALLLGYFVAYALLILGVQILYAYLALRYVMKSEMEKHPILFLRSFRYSETPAVFGRIVSPVASRFGVIIALTHQSQPPSDLHRDTSSIAQANVRFAADDSWQEILSRYLKSSSAAIIDLTVESQGVSWELHEALQTLGKHSVVVLSQRGAESSIPQEISVVEYDLDVKSFKIARHALRQWFLANPKFV